MLDDISFGEVKERYGHKNRIEIIETVFCLFQSWKL
jgi:hypothetical protein